MESIMESNLGHIDERPVSSAPLSFFISVSLESFPSDTLFEQCRLAYGVGKKTTCPISRKLLNLSLELT